MGNISLHNVNNKANKTDFSHRNLIFLIFMGKKSLHNSKNKVYKIKFSHRIFYFHISMGNLIE